MWVTLLYAVGRGACWHAAGIGRKVRTSHALGRARSAADICGFIQDHRPHSQRRNEFAESATGLAHAAPCRRAARKSVPSTHIRCRITASLRATAMTARRMAADLGQPQAPGLQRRPGVGARHQGVRGRVQRHAHVDDRRPWRCGPGCRSRPTGSAAASARSAPPRCVTSGSDRHASTPALKVSEVTGPTPGTVISRWQTGIVAHHGLHGVVELQVGLVQHRARIEQRQQARASSGSECDHAAHRLVEAAMATRDASRTPKIFSKPRSSFSRSTHLVRIALRLASSARTWWLSRLLT